MKKKILISIGLLVIVFVIIALIVFKMNNKTKKVVDNKANPISTKSTVELNTKQYINQLEKIKINGTDDTFIITEKVNFQGLSGSFLINVPYTFTVNGIEYNGIYTMGTNKNEKSIDDKNPKYDIQIDNIKNDYETKIIITNK